MSNGMNVYNFGQDVVFNKEVLERKLDPRLIKERKQGGTTLSYIGGHTVIRLLNEAFGYKWSFEIVADEIVPSLPKPVIEGWGKDRKPKIGPDGKQVVEEQPPVVKVLGRLTVPGVGVKEQYGSKVVIGGATEQEASFKSASTDALKKCATMFGIGLELYEDDDESPSTATTAPAPAQPKQGYGGGQSNYSKPAQTPQAVAPQATSYDPADIAKMKELKAVLGATDNAQLDPYVREFLDNPSASMQNISPSNVKAFIVFLSKKAANV